MPGHRFYSEKMNFESALLEGDEAYHLRKVLRLAPGDEVRVFDGNGREARASVEAFEPHTVTLRIIEELSGEVESPLAITLAQGLVKGERFEIVIQKAVELGIATLQPFVSRYTDV